jgi:hypothetical protein
MVASNSSHGIQAGGAVGSPSTGIVRISDNEVINNGANAVSIQTNGAVDTFLNNEFTGNGDNNCTGCTNVTANFK